jgi:hypothetical protein
MEYDIHTFLDLLTLGATCWVEYMMRVPLKSTYSDELDTIETHHVVRDSLQPRATALAFSLTHLAIAVTDTGCARQMLPCLALAVLAHPGTTHNIVHRVMWALCVYVEAVSVLPQLRMMQKAQVGLGRPSLPTGRLQRGSSVCFGGIGGPTDSLRTKGPPVRNPWQLYWCCSNRLAPSRVGFLSQVVERFTAHYVFALGIARFLSCAHWVLQIMDGDSFLLMALGSGIWPVMVLVSEIVQVRSTCWVTLRARWVTLRARWETLRARWESSAG